MARFSGQAVIPTTFFFRYLLPSLFTHRYAWRMMSSQVRKYLMPLNPEKDVPVGMVSLRANEVCNLRCASCGQWGENGHLLRKLQRGERLNELSFDVVKRIIHETARDKPFYYIWGGEPTMWKPLVPVFEEMAEVGVYGLIATNAHELGRVIEELMDTGALAALNLSVDGWDAASQNQLRSPAGGRVSDNFERTMAVIHKIEELKKRKRSRFPLVNPITVVSNRNYSRLVDIHRLVMDTTQIHSYYYGWFITEERARLHEQVFRDLFGYEPRNHRGYLKSCFNDVDPKVTAAQLREVVRMSRGRACVPQFFPHFVDEQRVRRYYEDHAWDCGYPVCRSIYYTAEISPDGRLTPCRDYQDFTAGNVNEDSFYGIWNGEKFKRFRRKLSTGLMPVCTRCCGLQGL